MIYNIFRFLKGALVTTGPITQPVHEIETQSLHVTKINYVVPAGKVFYFTGWFATLPKGEMTISFQVDAVEKDLVGLTSFGNSYASKANDNQIPIAIATAGQTVTAVRISGDANRDWAAGIQGYLEDV